MVRLAFILVLGLMLLVVPVLMLLHMLVLLPPKRFAIPCHHLMGSSCLVYGFSGVIFGSSICSRKHRHKKRDSQPAITINAF